MAHQWQVLQPLFSEQLSLALPDPDDEKQFKLPLEFNSRTESIVATPNNWTKNLATEKRNFREIYIKSIMTFREQLAKWDQNSAIKTLEIIISVAKDYLVKSSDIWEHYHFLDSFNEIKRDIEASNFDWKKPLLRTIWNAIDNVAFQAFVNFRCRSAEDKNFASWVQQFVKEAWDRIPLIKEWWVDIWEIAFSCIWHMNEYITFLWKDKLLPTIIRLIETNSWNRIFTMLCASFLSEILVECKKQWRRDLVRRILDLWAKLVSSCGDDWELRAFVMYKLVWNNVSNSSH